MSLLRHLAEFTQGVGVGSLQVRILPPTLQVGALGAGEWNGQTSQGFMPSCTLSLGGGGGLHSCSVFDIRIWYPFLSCGRAC